MQPVINCEEFIGKTVGRRVRPSPLAVQPMEIETSKIWRRQGFRPNISKGVYLFHSHEEADQWLTDHLTRKPVS